MSPVFAGDGYWSVRVLVAYDEEWQWTAEWVYAYSPKTLAALMVVEVSDRFYEQFQISFFGVSCVFWDSYDNPESADEMMDEAIAETGFCSNSETNVLVIFTGQDIPNVWGLADKVLGVVLVEYAYPAGVGQATDNILQHELSHLYRVPDEYVKDLDCVMNGYECWIGFPHNYKVPTALTTTNWCSGCWETISNNRGLWGTYASGGGGGFPRWCAW